MNNVELKLQEACFFFDILKKMIEDFNPEKVFYLSAFLSATRSVIYMMEAQTPSLSRQDYNIWKKKHSFLKSPSYEKFTNARDVVIHKNLPETNKYLIKHDFGPKGLTTGSGKTTNIEIKLFGNLKEDVSIKSEGIEIGRTIQERDLMIEFISMNYGSPKTIEFYSFAKDAEQYLRELKIFFNEWKLKFSTSNNSR